MCANDEVCGAGDGELYWSHAETFSNNCAANAFKVTGHSALASKLLDEYSSRRQTRGYAPEYTNPQRQFAVKTTERYTAWRNTLLFQAVAEPAIKGVAKSVAANLNNVMNFDDAVDLLTVSKFVQLAQWTDTGGGSSDGTDEQLGLRLSDLSGMMRETGNKEPLEMYFEHAAPLLDTMVAEFLINSLETCDNMGSEDGALTCLLEYTSNAGWTANFTSFYSTTDFSKSGAEAGRTHSFDALLPLSPLFGALSSVPDRALILGELSVAITVAS
jgi:hypothetical protein